MSEAGGQARYAKGDLVHIRKAYPIGHCRTPYYTRGLDGVVERMCGKFSNPEELAYGRDGHPPLPLYRIRISMGDLWPDYNGLANDTLEVEVFEHWLDPVMAEGTPEQ
ncbi:MAG: SH3-like domain-containing protein [Stappiaceae bacterium]